MAAMAMVGAVTLLSWLAFAMAIIGASSAPELAFLVRLSFANACAWLFVMVGVGFWLLLRRPGE